MIGYIVGMLASSQAVILAAAKSTSKEQVSALGTWGMWILIAVMIGVFYFLLIRPQRKRAQQQESMLNKLEMGDEIVTIGGIHGEIKNLTDDTVVLEVDKGVSITFNRSAIAKSLTIQEEEEEEVEEEETVEEEVTEEEEVPEADAEEEKDK